MKMSRIKRFFSLLSCFCGWHIWEQQQQTCRPVPCELWKRTDDHCGEVCKVAAAPVNWAWCKDCGNVQLKRLNVEALQRSGCSIKEEPTPLTWKQCVICRKIEVEDIVKRPGALAKWVALWNQPYDDDLE